MDWRSYSKERHRMGPASARVTVVVFSDFQCPYCKAFAGEARLIREEHPADVAVVFRHLPLSYHVHARPAALAAECAARQGRFGAMHDILFAQQDSLAAKPWGRFAEEAGISDTLAFAQCMSDAPAVEKTIARDSTAGVRIGVAGTPTILIRDLRLSGTPSLPELRRHVEAALHSG